MKDCPSCLGSGWVDFGTGDVECPTCHGEKVSFDITTDRDRWKAMALELGEELSNILDQTDGPESMIAPAVTTWNYANEALAKLKEMEL